MDFRYTYGPEHISFMKEQIWEAQDNLDVYSSLSAFEHEQLQTYIHHPKKVLDLGCGLGRAAIYLNAVFKDNDVQYVLADSTITYETSQEVYTDRPWNNMQLTESFCKLNGLSNFRTFDVKKDDWQELTEIDFITSRCAVGMHFPIEDYMDHLLSVASKKCLMIFGVRDYLYSKTSFKDKFEEVIYLSQPRKHPFPHQDWLVLKNKI